MRKIFKKLYKIVDVFIVVPISRLIYFLKKRLSKSRGVLDKFLNKPRFLLYLSLALSVVVFLLVDASVINLVQSQAEVITVDVTVRYNDKAYVVEGVPETVDVVISGSKGYTTLAKQIGEFEVVLDLTDYTANDSPYQVDFEYTKSIDNLSYDIVPEYANVIISKKVSDVATVSYELLNIDDLDQKLSVKEVELDQTEVVVKGSEKALEEISIVKALVDLDNPNLTEAGTYTLEDLKLVAYDNSGSILKNVEIVPETISSTIVLDSHSKNLPILVQTSGDLVAGKAISSIQINGSDTYALTAYGDKDALEDINNVPVTIDIDGLGKDSVKTYNVSLSKPANVRYMSTNTVTVAVTFGEESQRTMEIDSKIPATGLSNGLSANVTSTENISIQVKGVNNIISDINPEDINAYVDLTGLSKGTHEVSVKIDNTNPLVTYVASSTITVLITD